MRKTICMVVQDKMVKGGIAAVISGYYGSELETKYNMIYVESYKDGGKLTKLIKGIQGYCNFAKVLVLNKPDLIHIHSSFGPSFYRKLPFIYMASWAHIPIINHIHGANFDVFYRTASDKKRVLIRQVYSKCDKLIALSDEWKEKLSEIVSEEKITIIENYSVVHERAAIEKENRASNHTVLFLGEIGKRKGCYDIPEIVAQTTKKIPDVRFVLAGTGSPEDEAAIKDLLKEKNVIQNVVFPGWIRGKQKDEQLKKADIFILPSYNEGMPMSVLDAMGYGLPIVSTTVGGIPRIVQDGRNGFCIETGNTAAMSNAIVELLTDDNKRHRFGQGSIEIIKEKYSLEAHIDKLETVYNTVISHRR